MATTTNYSWTTPDDTALVKDGAAAIRSLGTAIDTTVFNNASAAIAKTIVDAKGDIIAATAADTVARLAVGSNNQVLTADSSTATGLKWATPAGGGKVLQVVHATTSTSTGSSVNTYADTTLTATITPSSATSTILVMVQQNGIGKTNVSTGVNLRLYRSTTNLGQFGYYIAYTQNSTADSYAGGAGFQYLDSPATTSATTYKTQFASAENNSYAYVQIGSAVSSITLLEIGA